MTLDEAKTVVADENPALLVDDTRPDVTYLLSVYREGDAARTNFDVRQYSEADLRAAVKGL